MNQIPNKEEQPVELDYFEYWVNEASRGRNVAECWQNIYRIQNHQLQKAREQSGKRNAVVKEYKDEGVMFILKIEDGKTYEASMPIPKWAEIGKLTLRDHSELDQDKKYAMGVDFAKRDHSELYQDTPKE